MFVGRMSWASAYPINRNELEDVASSIDVLLPVPIFYQTIEGGWLRILFRSSEDADLFVTTWNSVSFPGAERVRATRHAP